MNYNEFKVKYRLVIQYFGDDAFDWYEEVKDDPAVRAQYLYYCGICDEDLYAAEVSYNKLGEIANDHFEKTVNS